MSRKRKINQPTIQSTSQLTQPSQQLHQLQLLQLQVNQIDSFGNELQQVLQLIANIDTTQISPQHILYIDSLIHKIESSFHKIPIQLQSQISNNLKKIKLSIS